MSPYICENMANIERIAHVDQVTVKFKDLYFVPFIPKFSLSHENDFYCIISCTISWFFIVICLYNNVYSTYIMHNYVSISFTQRAYWLFFFTGGKRNCYHEVDWASSCSRIIRCLRKQEIFVSLNRSFHFAKFIKLDSIGFFFSIMQDLDIFAFLWLNCDEALQNLLLIIILFEVKEEVVLFLSVSKCSFLLARPFHVHLNPDRLHLIFAFHELGRWWRLRNPPWMERHS